MEETKLKSCEEKVGKYISKINAIMNVYKYSIESSLSDLEKNIDQNLTGVPTFLYYFLNRFAFFADSIFFVYNPSTNSYSRKSGTEYIDFGSIKYQIIDYDLCYLEICHDMKKDITDDNNLKSMYELEQKKNSVITLDYYGRKTQPYNDDIVPSKKPRKPLVPLFIDGIEAGYETTEDDQDEFYLKINYMKINEKTLIKIQFDVQRFETRDIIRYQKRILNLIIKIFSKKDDVTMYICKIRGGRIGNLMFSYFWELYKLSITCNNKKITKDVIITDFNYYFNFSGETRFSKISKLSFTSPLKNYSEENENTTYDQIYEKLNAEKIITLYDFSVKSDGDNKYNLHDFRNNIISLFKLMLSKDIQNKINKIKETNYMFFDNIALHFRGSDFCVTHENNTHKNIISFTVLHFRYYYDCILDVLKHIGPEKEKIFVNIFHHPYDTYTVDIMIAYLHEKLKDYTNIVFRKEKDLLDNIDVNEKMTEFDLINIISKFKYIVSSNSSFSAWPLFFSNESIGYVCGEMKKTINDVLIKYNFYNCYSQTDTLKNITIVKKYETEGEFSYLVPCYTNINKYFNALFDKKFDIVSDINYYDFYILLSAILQHDIKDNNYFTTIFSKFYNNITQLGFENSSNIKTEIEYSTQTADKIHVVYEIYKFVTSLNNNIDFIVDDPIYSVNFLKFIGILKKIKINNKLIVKLIDTLNYSMGNIFIEKITESF